MPTMAMGSVASPYVHESIEGMVRVSIVRWCDWVVVYRWKMKTMTMSYGRNCNLYCCLGTIVPGSFATPNPSRGRGSYWSTGSGAVLLGEIRTKVIGARLDQCTGGYPILFY